MSGIRGAIGWRASCMLTMPMGMRGRREKGDVECWESRGSRGGEGRRDTT